MPKKHAGDLMLAILAIGRADTVAGGLVELTRHTDATGSLVAKTDPIVKWGELVKQPALNRPPIVAVQVLPWRFWRGAPEALVAPVQFDCVVPDHADDLESEIAERLIEQMSTPNFAAQGLDVAADMIQAGAPPGIEESGRRRITMDWTMNMKR